jgi:predicted regulator of Ras-like GTPase activity (Roadblock/LC7/MglB family)
MTEFIPPTFGNIGKKVADLFKKKFEDSKKHTLTIKNKSKTGVNVESVATVESKISGATKATYKEASLGEFEVNCSTRGDLKGQATLDKLFKGLKVILSGGHGDLAGKEPGFGAKASAEYSQDFFSSTLDVTVNPEKSSGKVDASVVIGFDGLSVGGEVKTTVNNEANFDLADHNFGVQYAKDDFIAALKTSCRGDIVTASYHHTISKEQQAAGQFVYNPDGEASQQKVFTIGCEHQLDKDTTIKGMLDSNGNLSTFIQHSLASPKVQLGLSSIFKLDASNTSASLSSKSFGIALTVGDF